MARACLTAVILATMATPATAHPTLEDYMDHHGAEIGFAPGIPMLKHPVWQMDARARDEWRRIDKRYEARQRRLEREREAQTVAEAIPPPVSLSADWEAIALCESSGNWAETEGLFEGGLQFLPSTWDAYAPPSYPEAAYLATPAQQMYVGELVLAAQGPAAWPNCFVAAS